MTLPHLVCPLLQQLGGEPIVIRFEISSVYHNLREILHLLLVQGYHDLVCLAHQPQRTRPDVRDFGEFSHLVSPLHSRLQLRLELGFELITRLCPEKFGHHVQELSLLHQLLIEDLGIAERGILLPIGMGINHTHLTQELDVPISYVVGCTHSFLYKSIETPRVLTLLIKRSLIFEIRLKRKEVEGDFH